MSALVIFSTPHVQTLSNTHALPMLFTFIIPSLLLVERAASNSWKDSALYLSQICEHGPWLCFPLIKSKSSLVINPVSSRCCVCLEVQSFVLCHEHGMCKAAGSCNALGTEVTRDATLMTRETSFP